MNLDFLYGSFINFSPGGPLTTTEDYIANPTAITLMMWSTLGTVLRASYALVLL